MQTEPEFEYDEYDYSPKQHLRQYDKILKRKYRQTPNGKKSTARYTIEKRLTLLWLLGNKCVKCGFTDERALQFDHINGGGSYIRRYTTVWTMYRYYLNNPELALKELQILCANCNSIKRIENNECKVSNWRIGTHR